MEIIGQLIGILFLAYLAACGWGMIMFFWKGLEEACNGKTKNYISHDDWMDRGRP
jgi:hypothetical protein